MSTQPAIIRTQAEIAEATTEQLVATYNAMLGKSIKKFENRSIAEAKVSMAILSAIDAAGHAGVPKDTTPTAKTAQELATTTRNKEDPSIMATKKTTPTAEAKPAAKASAKPAAAPAKKVAAKASAKPAKKVAPAAKSGRRASPEATDRRAAPAAKPERHNTYSRIKYTEPDTTRRPQEGSKRTTVLNALKARGTTTLDQLSTDVGFDVRSFAHKLVAVGYAEILPAEATKGA